MSVREVDDYLAALAPEQRAALDALRTAILTVVPDAEQGISYGAPAFRVDGKLVAGFAAATHHLSYLPHSGTVVATLADDLVGRRTTKGSVTFVPDAPLPPDLVERLVHARLAELGITPPSP